MAWYSQLDPGRIDHETRLRVLRFTVEKHGKQVVIKALGISCVTLWRYLNGRQEIPDDKLLALFSSGLVSRSEFERLVSAGQRLRALGILRDDDTIDYG